MRKIYEVGDVVMVHTFCYKSKNSGTNMVDRNLKCEFGQFNWGPCYNVPEHPQVRLTKAWDDYETGWRYHAIPITSELSEFLVLHGVEQKVYVGEFDIVN